MCFSMDRIGVLARGPGARFAVAAVRFSPSGERLAVGGGGGTLHLFAFNDEASSLAWETAVWLPTSRDGRECVITGLHWSADEKAIAVGCADGSVLVALGAYHFRAGFIVSSPVFLHHSCLCGSVGGVPSSRRPAALASVACRASFPFAAMR